MKNTSVITVQLLIWFVVLSGCSQKKPADKPKPDIVIIYADDMGFGDLNIQNPDSKIPTPYLDQLALEGMRFIDAHSSSEVCSPSRWGVRYLTAKSINDHGQKNLS
ncbi:MAG: sulfatase-like hydrolase/transferase [Balneolales bacterium]|nr:sulfatase-like hydrolase/transferase [Balneolales bacterium]